MPDILTHVLFAEKVAAGLKDANVKHFILENEKLFMLGAQGPDMFFYFKPWNPYGKLVRRVGEAMHHLETGMFFRDAIEILGKTTGREYERLLTYILGFLCHYYCDRGIHPYVYAMTAEGCFKYSGGARRLSHYQIEAGMDERLWMREKGRHASEAENFELVDPGHLPDEVVDHLSNYIYKSQKKIITEYEIRKSYKNMIRILKILYDPKKRKRKIINILPIPRKCYVDDVYPGVDLLNEKKRTWKHADGSGESDLSVSEMFDKAAGDCIETANQVCEHLEHGKQKDFNLLIPDWDYCSKNPGE